MERIHRPPGQEALLRSVRQLRWQIGTLLRPLGNILGWAISFNFMKDTEDRSACVSVPSQASGRNASAIRSNGRVTVRAEDRPGPVSEYPERLALYGHRT